MISVSKIEVHVECRPPTMVFILLGLYEIITLYIAI